MERPLAQLGRFMFSPSVGSYEELERTWQITWAKPDPIGSSPVKQFMGPGDELMTISGGIWPEIQMPGMWKIEDLAAAAKTGRTMSFVLGNGRVLGQWCVEEVSEYQTLIESGGYPGEISFSISMSRDTGGGLGSWPF